MPRQRRRHDDGKPRGTGARGGIRHIAAGSGLSLFKGSAWLHALFNAGLVLFVPALTLAQPLAVSLPSLLLAGPLLGFAAAAAVNSLLHGNGPRVLRAGIGMAASSLAPTALMGAALVAIVLGRLAWPIDRVADLHAVVVPAALPASQQGFRPRKPVKRWPRTAGSLDWPLRWHCADSQRHEPS